MLFPSSISYPKMFDYNNGETLLLNETASINNCLGLLLCSAHNELLGDPDFGCGLYELLFSQDTELVQDTIKATIKESIDKYENRVTVETNDIIIQKLDNTDNLCYTITINYKIKKSSLEGTFNINMEENT